MFLGGPNVAEKLALVLFVPLLVAGAFIVLVALGVLAPIPPDCDCVRNMGLVWLLAAAGAMASDLLLVRLLVGAFPWLRGKRP